jgi:hypothetical protein
MIDRKDHLKCFSFSIYFLFNYCIIKKKEEENEEDTPLLNFNP